MPRRAVAVEPERVMPAASAPRRRAPSESPIITALSPRAIHALERRRKIARIRLGGADLLRRHERGDVRREAECRELFRLLGLRVVGDHGDPDRARQCLQTSSSAPGTRAGSGWYSVRWSRAASRRRAASRGHRRRRTTGGSARCALVDGDACRVRRRDAVGRSGACFPR